ncbi:MAG TPA: hypothetical protein VLA44_00205 [Clostridia bacterium]|nr:hypothetical protein [Clostridia bacterium]
MTDHSGEAVRRSGRGQQPDGALLTWSIAEGTRGRRWRATTTVDGILHQALVLETNGARRVAKLEIASNAGLLTVHPEPDERELHGNVVLADGVRHLRFEWSPRHELLVAGMALVSVAAIWRLGEAVGVGEGVDRPAVVVDLDLTCRPAVARFERVDETSWIVGTDALRLEVRCDRDGVPRLDDAREWPLEV